MSPDPLGILSGVRPNPQSWNLYSYVLNNPLNAVDPDGLDCVYVFGNSVDVQSGDCTNAGGKDDDGIFVDGTIDRGSGTYNAATGSVGFTFTTGSGALGSGTIRGVYPSAGVSDADRFNALIQGTQMAAPGVNAAFAGLMFFGNIVAPGSMTLAQCLVAGCTKTDVGLGMLPEVAALREGAILLKEGAAVGKGAEILEKTGGAAQAAKEYEAIPGAEKIYGGTKVKTLPDGSGTVVLYDSTTTTRATIAVQDSTGRTVTKFRY
jgi:hypothetical protein